MNKFLQFMLVVILAVATSYYFEGRPKGYSIDKIIDFKNFNFSFTDENYDNTLISLKRAYQNRDTIIMEDIISSLPKKYYKKADIKYLIAKYYLLKKDTLTAYYTFDYNVRKLTKVNEDSTYLLLGVLIYHSSEYRYDDAIYCFQLFLEKHPESDTTLFLIGKMNYKQQYYSTAVEFFNKCIEINPKNIKNIGEMFDAYTFLDDSIQTLNYLNSLNKNYPEQKEILVQLARYYMWTMKNNDSAYYFAQKAITKAPNDKLANYIMAAYNYNNSRYSNALTYIDKTYKLDSSDAYTCQLKGWILFYLKEYENTEIWLDKTLSLFGTSEPNYLTYYYLAYSCEKLKKYQKAIQFYSKYVTNIADEDKKTEIYSKIDELEKLYNN